jgi:hypothetical protein
MSLWKLLETASTPQTLLDQIKQGILSRDLIQSTQEYNHKSAVTSSFAAETESSTSVISPFSGDPSECQPDIVLAKAVHQQSNDLGWEQFHRGQISTLWAEACYELNLQSHKSTDNLHWATTVVRHILNYILTLWKYMCKRLHGSMIEAAKCLELSKLCDAMASAYKEFQEDQLIIYTSLHYIFSVPLGDCLTHDRDTLKCFLATFNKGKLQQQLIRDKMSETARTFFFPRSLPTAITLRECDLESCVSTLSIDSLPSFPSSESSLSLLSLSSPTSSRTSLRMTSMSSEDEDDGCLFV